MIFLKKVFNFYINSSLHVALAVYAFIRITEYYYNLPYNENLNYFIFFGTITGYNFVKYAGVAKLHHKSLTTDLKIIQVFSFCCFLALCYYTYTINIKTLWVAAPFVGLTILYAVPFLSGFEKNLRQISFLKILIVAIVWMGFTVLLPLVDVKETITLNLVLLCIQRFLLVIVLILPFDIRDVKYDAISLQTIPKKIGIPLTKKMGLIFLLFSLVLEFIITPSNFTKCIFLIFFLITTIFVMRSKENQSKYYSSFWVEAIPIVWWLLLLGFHNN